MSNFNQEQLLIAQNLLQICRQKQKSIACAESCTGGLLAALLTETPGSSDVFDRGFVVYSNQAKIDMLKVNPKILEKFGAVSKETAAEMALGAIKNSRSSIAIAITGIAGPSGGSEEKPVGMVFIGIACDEVLDVKEYNFAGSRSEIRNLSIFAAMQSLIRLFG